MSNSSRYQLEQLMKKLRPHSQPPLNEMPLMPLDAHPAIKQMEGKAVEMPPPDGPAPLHPDDFPPAPRTPPISGTAKTAPRR